MSDIIQGAKRLLDGATPGPWSFQPWSKYTGPNGDYEESALLDSDGETLCDGLPDSEGELIAAAPALAELVADETWEYIVQVKRADQWQFYIGESRLPTDKPGLATGFSKLEHALEFSKMETKRPTRIVRRRVSPVEVINE